MVDFSRMKDTHSVARGERIFFYPNSPNAKARSVLNRPIEIEPSCVDRLSTTKLSEVWKEN
ncbi:MAG: hypothetical protein D6680_00660 [Cyanobacteria bacterium J007]|nr:MAG: hypothetical protein D6680_00660 [Cyanobacteria bacterium J007]